MMHLFYIEGWASMDSEISVEGIAENVLKELKDEFFERVSLTTAGKVSPSGVLNQTKIEDERKSIKKIL